MKKITFLSLAFITLLLTRERLSAYQCVAPVLDTEEDFRLAVSTYFGGSSAVLSSEVTEIDRFKIRFKMREVWKGDFKEEVTLVAGAYISEGDLIVSSRCGPLLEIGKSYLVLARGPKVNCRLGAAHGQEFSAEP